MSLDFGSIVKDVAASGPREIKTESQLSDSCARLGFLFGACSVIGFFVIMPLMGIALGTVGLALCLLSVIVGVFPKKEAQDKSYKKFAWYGLGLSAIGVGMFLTLIKGIMG